MTMRYYWGFATLSLFSVLLPSCATSDPDVLRLDLEAEGFKSTSRQDLGPGSIVYLTADSMGLVYDNPLGVNTDFILTEHVPIQRTRIETQAPFSILPTTIARMLDSIGVHSANLEVGNMSVRGVSWGQLEPQLIQELRANDTTKQLAAEGVLSVVVEVLEAGDYRVRFTSSSLDASTIESDLSALGFTITASEDGDWSIEPRDRSSPITIGFKSRPLRNHGSR